MLGYLEFVGLRSPHLSLYYSGHGVAGHIKLADIEKLYYKDLLDYIATSIQDHHLKSLRQVTKEVRWNLIIYLDACHSGSII